MPEEVAAARDREQPQPPVVALPAQVVKHRKRVAARQPFVFGHHFTLKRQTSGRWSEASSGITFASSSSQAAGAKM